MGHILVAPPPVENTPPPQCVPPPCVASRDAGQQVVGLASDQQDANESWLDRLSGFLISGTIHLALLLILALIAKSDQTPTPIVMTLSNVDAEEPALLESMDAVTLDTLAPNEFTEESTRLELDLFTDAKLELAVSDLEAPKSSPPTSEVAVGSAMANAGAKEPDDSVSFFGTHAYGSKFVYVLDVSGSMSAGNGSRMMRARAELMRSLQELKPHHSFYIVLYNTGAIKMLGEPGTPQLRPATAENKKLAMRWISYYRPTGGTFPGEALKIAGDLKPDAVFFLSDGDFIYSGGPGGMPSTVSQFLNEFGSARLSGLRGATPRLFPKDALDAYAPEIVVHTIALESESSRRKMEWIAAMKDGEHRFIPAGRQAPRRRAPAR